MDQLDTINTKLTSSFKSIRCLKVTDLTLFLIFLFAFPIFSKAERKDIQQNKHAISGIVTDARNEPLPGVTIQVVGKQGGVITDVDGRYSIDAASNEQLRFQYVG